MKVIFVIMVLTIIENRLPIKVGVLVERFDDEVTVLLKRWIAPFWNIDYSNNCVTLLKIISTSSNVMATYRDGICYIGNHNSVEKIVDTILYHARIIFKLCATQFGFVNLHAACIAYDNVGVLIDTPRNNGKTTVLLEALSDGGFSLVANDQVMLNYKNMFVYGYPATIGLRTNTLSDNLKSKVIWHENDPFFNDKKPVIHITDIAIEFNSSICPQVQVNVLVNYSKADDFGELCIETRSVDYLEKLRNMEFSLNMAYVNEWIDYYMDIVNKIIPINSYVYQNQAQIILLSVLCGKNRIIDLLEEIKTTIREL
jgi:hypothetical protein